MLAKQIEDSPNISFSNFTSNSVKNTLFLEQLIDEESVIIASNFKNKQLVTIIFPPILYNL